MTHMQLQEKVMEYGDTGVRAYWTESFGFTEKDFMHRGQLGDLFYHKGLHFAPDNGQDIVCVNDASEVHAPSIGHYSW